MYTERGANTLALSEQKRLKVTLLNCPVGNTASSLESLYEAKFLKLTYRTTCLLHCRDSQPYYRS